MPFCSDCGEHYFDLPMHPKHRCKEFYIYHRDYREDDPYKLYASGFEEAAKKYTEMWWNDDPFDPSDLDITIEVVFRSERKYFKMSAYTDVVFNAKALE